MLALSTSWKSSQCDHGLDLLAAVRAFDPAGVELEYRIHQPMFNQMRDALKQSGLPVSSIHNFFPHPADMPRHMAGGDLFSLAAPDSEERSMAVRYTRQCLECANDLEAGVVVLHCGQVDMEHQKEKIYEFEKEGVDSESAEAFWTVKLAEREAKEQKHLDALCRSLEQLLKSAEKQGVRLGLENRYHYYQIPNLDEFDRLFHEFEGAPMGYWHDMGHAHAQELLGLVPAGSYLDRYGSRLVGMHLHDAKGLDDHMAPGAGEIDFEPVKALASDGLPCVMELRPGTPDEAVEEGIEHLRRIGIR